ncbi:MAG: D-alanyl-D-alanine carboxypeptidase/D-alanyl-D-alanine-endopeptidase [Bryobacterales bacterium]|nr:D-alanyl-D-alanine carboxypeptidase/D-alanyl-D-alanine-endopeptidase [Bryobacterales bacterium]
MRVLAVILCAAGMCWGQGIEARVEGLLAKYPAVAKGSWGAYAVDLGTGAVVFAREADRTFVPASNNKLFASGYALSKLGPEHRFVTRVVAAKAVDGQGVVDGDLVLEGGGDPSLSGREWPYRRNGNWREAYAPLEEMAGQVWERGVRRIRGDVVGDDRAYVHEPFPPGWGMDDTLYDYGAPVSALVVHDNYVTVRLEAGQAGEVAHVRVIPEGGYFQIVNRTVSVAAGRSSVTERRSGDGRVIELEGRVAAGSPVAMGIALDDPARYAAHVFRRLLQARGIVVEGEARARHRYEAEAAGAGAEVGAEGVELARRSSPPMAEVVQMTNKLSQNLYAELLLREAARVEGKSGSRRAAIAGLGGWLRGLGVKGRSFRFLMVQG